MENNTDKIKITYKDKDGVERCEQISFLTPEDKETIEQSRPQFTKDQAEALTQITRMIFSYEPGSVSGSVNIEELNNTLDAIRADESFYEYFFSIAEDEKKLTAFLKTFTPETFEKAGVDLSKYETLSAQLNSYSPLDIIASLFTYSELLDLYHANKPQLSKKSVKQQAIEAGAIVNVADRIPTITNPHYRNAFTTTPNKYAYITPKTKNLLELIQWNEETETFSAAPSYDIERRQNFEDTIKAGAANPDNVLDPAIIGALFAAFKMARFDANGEEIEQPLTETIKIYLPTFRKFLNIRKESITFDESGQPIPTPTPENGKENKRGNNWNEFVKLEYYYSVFDGAKLVDLLHMKSFDEETQIAEIDLSGIVRTYIKAAEDEKNTYKKNQKELKRPYFHEMKLIKWHNIRDKKAAEIAHNILIEIAERGTTPDAEQRQNKKLKLPDKEIVTIKIKFKDIIKFCPKLKQELNATAANKNKNDILRRHFKKAYEILKDRTLCSLTEQYLDVSFNEDITPTTTTLNNCFVITHRGKAR